MRGAVADVRMRQPVLPREEAQTAENPVVADDENSRPARVEDHTELVGTEVADRLEYFHRVPSDADRVVRVTFRGSPIHEPVTWGTGDLSGTRRNSG